jgi:hypothetical protein
MFVGHGLMPCGKSQSVVIPRHVACRGISLSLGFDYREIPHFACLPQSGSE